MEGLSPACCEETAPRTPHLPHSFAQVSPLFLIKERKKKERKERQRKRKRENSQCHFIFCNTWPNTSHSQRFFIGIQWLLWSQCLLRLKSRPARQWYIRLGPSGSDGVLRWCPHVYLESKKAPTPLQSCEDKTRREHLVDWKGFSPDVPRCAMG